MNNPLRHFIKRDIRSYSRRHEKWTDFGDAVQCNECGKEFSSRRGPEIKGHYNKEHPDKTKWTYQSEE